MIHPTASNELRSQTTHWGVPILLAVSVTLALPTTSCRKRHEPVSTTPVDQPIASRPPSEEASAEPVKSIGAATLPIPDQAWSQGRWLEVITPDPKTPGGWATGSFDRGKNKLIIVARDVQRFIVKADMIRIDWDRRVILSLNHVNSELRRREEGVLTFDLDRHGQWVVLEPPANERRN